MWQASDLQDINQRGGVQTRLAAGMEGAVRITSAVESGQRKDLQCKASTGIPYNHRLNRAPLVVALSQPLVGVQAGTFWPPLSLHSLARPLNHGTPLLWRFR